MGGVDLADQRIATYKKHLKTSTWYLALFYHCLEQSCLNAFIVEQATPAHVRPKRTQLQFHEDLMTQSIGGRSYVKKAGRPSTPVAAEARFDQSQFHHLVKIESKRACVVHVQEVRTVYQCAVCERAVWDLVSCIITPFSRSNSMIPQKQDQRVEPKDQDNMLNECTFFITRFSELPSGFHGNQLEEKTVDVK